MGSMLSGFITSQTVPSHLSQHYSPIPQTHPDLHDFINPLWIACPLIHMPYPLQLMYTAQWLVRLRILGGIMPDPTRGSVSQDPLTERCPGHLLDWTSALNHPHSYLGAPLISRLYLQTLSSHAAALHTVVRAAVISFTQPLTTPHWACGRILASRTTAAFGEEKSSVLQRHWRVTWEEGFFVTYSGSPDSSASWPASSDAFGVRKKGRDVWWAKTTYPLFSLPVWGSLWDQLPALGLAKAYFSP